MSIQNNINVNLLQLVNEILMAYLRTNSLEWFLCNNKCMQF